jgi:CBS-domain-containing membrane protein
MSQIPEYQQRVITEKTDLDEKLSKLSSFIEREDFRSIVRTDEQERLIRQKVIMGLYSEVLAERVASFS